MEGWVGSYTHQAGDSFIFKGGVTWPLYATATVGLRPQKGGSVSAWDYYGVDTAWFAGASWTRPAFDGSGATTSKHLICLETRLHLYLQKDMVWFEYFFQNSN